MKTISLPVMTVLLAVEMAASCLLAVNQMPWSLTLIPLMVAASFLVVRQGTKIDIPTKLAALILIVCPLLCYAYAIARMPSPGADDAVLLAGRKVTFIARLDGAASSSDDDSRWRLAPLLMVAPYRRALTGQMLLYIKSDRHEMTVDADDLVCITANIVKPRKPEFPWQFDRAAYLARRHIFSTVYAGCDEMHRCTPGEAALVAARDQVCSSSIVERLRFFDRQCQSLRRALVQTHAAILGEQEGDLLSSMVLGDRAVKVNDEVSQAFRDVGLSHLLAASGFNLTLVTAVTYCLTRQVIPSLRITNLVCFTSMLVFVALAGASPSILRAALMCTLVLGTRSLFRSIDVTSALALAFILTMVGDPWSIADVGLQLSYVATAGIICGAEPLSQLIYSGKAKIKKWCADTLAVVIVAQGSVLPLQVNYFWQAGAMFLPANLLVAPCVTPVTILGFASSLSGIAAVLLPTVSQPFGLIATVCDRLAHWPLVFMLAVAYRLSSFAQARMRLGAPTPVSLLVYYAALSLLLYSLRTKKHRSFNLLVFALAIFLLLWRPPVESVMVACFKESIVICDRNRNAFVSETSASANSFERDRFLSYYAINTAAPSAFTCCQSPCGSLISLGHEKLKILLASKRTDSACGADLILLVRQSEHTLRTGAGYWRGDTAIARGKSFPQSGPSLRQIVLHDASGQMHSVEVITANGVSAIMLKGDPASRD